MHNMLSSQSPIHNAHQQIITLQNVTLFIIIIVFFGGGQSKEGVPNPPTPYERLTILVYVHDSPCFGLMIF